ncbi:unnamed protein product [Thelazia callipaeda]|uniref:Uncharacterized protein n=1 Tax=Thelazia callipaeda TaxID=103827 RepID=A0A0N5CYK5_THECL|nr:unnamed protein product [Thelazia callipaeda]
MSQKLFPWETITSVDDDGTESTLLNTARTSLIKKVTPDRHSQTAEQTAEELRELRELRKSQDDGTGITLMQKIRDIFPLLRRSKAASAQTVAEALPETAVITEGKSLKETVEPKEKQLNIDVRHFRRPHILIGSDYYWFIIFKGIIASLCVALNTIHLLQAVGFLPSAFTLFKFKTNDYNQSITLTVDNINKLIEDRVGLVVRWIPYSEQYNTEEKYTNCPILINNYQWSEWTKFGHGDNKGCGVTIYVRYYHLRILKTIRTTAMKESLQTRCPATVQYKRVWNYACCPEDDTFEPLENYADFPYDDSLCIVKSSLRVVSASHLSKVCSQGQLWAPLPMADITVSDSFYQRSKIVKSYEIQRGKALNNYWIGVERVNGTRWLVNGQLINLDSGRNCAPNCYNMVF